MDYTYIAITFFSLFALFIPASFLLASKLLRKNEPGNPVKNSPYESAEASVGSHRDIDNEYLPYFMLFIPLEILSIVLLLWSVTASSLGIVQDSMYLGITVMSTAFALVGYRFITDKHVGE